MHTALQAMLVTPITHAPYIAMDGYGKPSYGAAVTEMAKVEFRPQKVVDQTGIERMSRAKVFLNSTVTMDIKDQIVLPDGTAPPILELYEVLDVTGVRSHWEARM